MPPDCGLEVREALGGRQRVETESRGDGGIGVEEPAILRFVNM